MTIAGHPDPADWLPAVGAPDRIVTESMADGRAIEAVGVAHELIGLLPVLACATRLWSAADPAITCAVTTALPSPFVVSATAAARLSAHYAVAGVLSWTMIDDTVTGAFGDALGEHASDIDRIIAAVIEALVAAGIPTALAAAGAAPFAGYDGGELSFANQDSPVTRWLDAAGDRFFTALGRAFALLTAFDTWAQRIMRPVWIITVPGGKLSSTWCTRLSRLLSGVLPMTVCCAGIFGGWHAARLTSVWGGTWQGAWPGITLWVFTWWAVSLLPEKLLGFWLRPAPTPHCDRSRPRAPELLVVADETAPVLGLAERGSPRPCPPPTDGTAAPREPRAAALRRIALDGRKR
jgi:hypothetical protein